MGIRFESNYQRIVPVTPYVINDADPLQRWVRVHEWNVDTGFTGKLLMVMYSVEPQWATPVTSDYGWVRVLALLDTVTKTYVNQWETRMQGASMTNKQATPRLVIVPTGSGITFTAGQGLMTTCLGQGSNQLRWWSCYVIDAEAV